MSKRSPVRFDIIAIGDTTLDVFLEIDEATVQCDINKEHCRLCLNYADKIPVKRITSIAGVGNAANNAVGSSRLGLKAAIYTIVGNDQTGKDILNNFRREKVASPLIVRDKKRGSNYSTVLNFQGERTILVFHEKRTYVLPKLPKVSWVYYTSMGHGFATIHPALVRYVRSGGAKLAFNPGSHQLRAGVHALQSVLSVTEVLLVNKEEGEKLVGETSDIKTLGQRLRNLGPRLVVITDGPAGAYTFDDHDLFYLPIFESPVVERTGCGDAFSTGFISALFYDQSVQEAMRWGSFNSVGVLGEIGAQKGLLTKKQVSAVLRKYSRYQPVMR